jgi:hypothetical protein
MQTPFFEYKKQGQGWKSLVRESYETAGGLAILTIPFLMLVENETVHKTIAVPFTLITAPLIFGEHTIDYLKRAKEEWKRREIGPTEQNILNIFGDIAVKGYTPWGGGIEMRFKEASVVSVYNDRETYTSHPSEIHGDREICVDGLLGEAAAHMTGKTTAPLSIKKKEARYLVVRKAGDLQSTFYTATQIEHIHDAPEDTIATARHCYYESITKGACKNVTHYAIKEADAQTAQQLRGLGL